MSDWEMVENEASAQPQPKQSASDWEMIETPVSQQKQNETFGQSLGKAPFRIAEDVYGGINKFAHNIPGYYQAAKTEIPAAAKMLFNDQGKAQQQAYGGLAEAGKNIFNSPHDIINYLSERLNLVPKDINKMVQMGRMPEDTQEMINQQFGIPQAPGESLIRGAGRNAVTGLGLGGIGNVLNPMKLTAKNIAKDVLREERKQVLSHTKQYNNIWKQADKSGFNNVPADISKLTNNLNDIKKYKTPGEYKSLDNFIKNPSLQNAQKAQSDMNIIHRKLEEKSRKNSLTSEEKATYDAALDAEKHIESNMFKNQKGNINKDLQRKYKDLTSSYRENVVPYKYNQHIQAYKNREMLAPELVNALSRGEFAAKKGSNHKAMGFRNNLKPLLTGAGVLGGGLSLLDMLLGNRNRPENEGNY